MWSWYYQVQLLGVVLVKGFFPKSFLLQIVIKEKDAVNKTRCQLCKRLAWPIILHSWTCKQSLERWRHHTHSKSHPIPSMGSEEPFFCVSGHIRHGDDRQPTQLGDPLEQSCSWPVRQQSVAMLLRVTNQSQMSQKVNQNVGNLKSHSIEPICFLLQLKTPRN